MLCCRGSLLVLLFCPLSLRFSSTRTDVAACMHTEGRCKFSHPRLHGAVCKLHGELSNYPL